MKKLYLLLVSLSFCTSLFAQYYVVTGKIFDNADKVLLPNAQVLIVGEAGARVIADEDGNYRVAVLQREVELEFRHTGYENVIKKVSFEKKDAVKLDVGMSLSGTQMLNEVYVTGERYSVEKLTNPQSVDVISLKDIERKNATTLDNALGSVAGLTIIDNEPQVRGGSGFSSGMGSRVMITLDDMPILRADAGRPAWNLVPMEDVAQIEVMKGASSVMYGSAAINGVINVRTQFAKSEPVTKIGIYGGYYNKPADLSKSPWGNGTFPLKFGATMSHARKIGKKVDITAAVEYADDDGYRGGTGWRDKYGSAPFAGNQENWLVKAERRIRANAGVQYNISRAWQLSLNGNVMYSDNNQCHFWSDANTGIYNTYPGTLSHFIDLMAFVDPQVKYTDRFGGIHNLKNRVLYSDNKGSSKMYFSSEDSVKTIKQNAASLTTYNAYTYKKKLSERYNWNINAGISNQYAYSYGTVFSGIVNESNTDTVGTHFANNLAVFFRTDISVLKQKNLNISFGGRWESCFIDDFYEGKPIFQVGLNYHIPVSYTYFRFNVGQGYRAATIGERYITTIVGNYGFYPNPELKSETSVNTEFAIQQMAKFGEFFEGYIDIAGFYQIYDNYIEFAMGPFKPNKTSSELGIGFMFFNTGPARIYGTEAQIAGKGRVGRYFEYMLTLGYTYSIPQSLNGDYVYKETPGMIHSLKKQSLLLPTIRETLPYKMPDNLLKYRIQHVGKSDVYITFIKRFTLGFSAKYFSNMKNVDVPFYKYDADDFPFYGVREFMNRQQYGMWVFDMRFAFETDKFTAAVTCNNLLNKEYSLRPLHVEAPRTIVVSLNYKFSDFIPGKFFTKKKYNNGNGSM